MRDRAGVTTLYCGRRTAGRSPGYVATVQKSENEPIEVGWPRIGLEKLLAGARGVGGRGEGKKKRPKGLHPHRIEL